MSRASIYRPQWGGAPGGNTQMAMAVSRQLMQLGAELGTSWRETLRLMGEVWARKMERSKQMQYHADVEKARGIERMGAGIAGGIERGTRAYTRGKTLEAELKLRKQQMDNLERHRRVLEGQGQERMHLGQARESRLNWEGWRKDVGDAVSFAVGQAGKAASRGMDYAETYRKQNVDLYKTFTRAETDLIEALGEQRRTGSLKIEEPGGDDVMFGPTRTTYQQEPKLMGKDRQRATQLLEDLRKAKQGLGAKLGQFAPQTPAVEPQPAITAQPIEKAPAGPVRVTPELLDRKGLRKPSQTRMPTDTELSDARKAPEPEERVKPTTKPPTEEGEPLEVPDKRITDTSRQRREPAEKPRSDKPVGPGWRKGWSGPISVEAVDVLVGEAGLDQNSTEVLFQRVNAKARQQGHDENQIRKIFVSMLQVIAQRRRNAELSPENEVPD